MEYSVEGRAHSSQHFTICIVRIAVLRRLMGANMKQSILCLNEFLNTWVNQVTLVSAGLLRSFNIV